VETELYQVTVAEDEVIPDFRPARYRVALSRKVRAGAYAWAYLEPYTPAVAKALEPVIPRMRPQFVAGGVAYVPDLEPAPKILALFGKELREVDEIVPAVAPLTPPPILPMELGLLRAILNADGVDDDGRVASVKYQVRAENELHADMMKMPAASLLENDLGHREAHEIMAWIAYRENGGDPDRGAFILGHAPPVTRLFVPACSAADEAEAEELARKESEAKSDAARARIAATMATPTRKTCGERVVYELHSRPEYVVPAWLERAAEGSPNFYGAARATPLTPDCTLPDGTRVFVEPAFAGLIVPECPPYRILQGDDVSPIPHTLANLPVPPTDAAYFRLTRRLPIDTSERPEPWRQLNSATKQMLTNRRHLLRRAPPAVAMHEREVIVRGCLVPPATGARWEFADMREEELAAERVRNLTNPPDCRDTEEEIARTVDQRLTGRYAALLATYVRAAGPGFVPWGSCWVTPTEQAVDVATGFLDKVRDFLFKREEPVTSEELAKALGVPVDSPDLFKAAEVAGWVKSRKMFNGERARLWIRASR
jgi:hypothetical protein